MGALADAGIELLLKGVLACKWISEALLRIVGPVFVVLALTLISAVSYVFFKAILPYHVPEIFSFAGIAHLLFDAFLLQGFAFNYFMAIFTPPGSPPKLSELDLEKLGDLRSEKAPRRGEGFSRWCKLCKMPKPVRTHHCHVCKRCVLRMDHHCPWVSNCVGHYNHKYFYLFMLYLWLGCLYGSFMFYGPFRDTTNFKIPWRGLSSRGTIIFVFVLTAAVGVALTLMLGWHTYLVVTGQTTIEFYFNRFKAHQARARGEKWENPFDLGPRNNWRYFFGRGRYWFSWMFPSLQLGPGDGLTYPTRKDCTYDQFFA